MANAAAPAGARRPAHPAKDPRKGGPTTALLTVGLLALGCAGASHAHASNDEPVGSHPTHNPGLPTGRREAIRARTEADRIARLHAVPNRCDVLVRSTGDGHRIMAGVAPGPEDGLVMFAAEQGRGPWLAWPATPGTTAPVIRCDQPNTATFMLDPPGQDE